MPPSRLVFLFLVAETSAIFFGGGGGGCGCNCCQPPAPPPPVCSCPPPVPAPSCNGAPPVPPPPPISNYAVPPPPPPPMPASYPISGPVPPPPSRDTYSILSAGTHSQPSSSSEVDGTSQEKVPASSFSNEPVPISIEKPAPPKFEDYLPPAPPRSSTRTRLNFKTKADADDYEILSNSGFRRKPQKRSKDTKCVNEQLRRIILKCISQASSTEDARISISTTAKEVFGYNFDVICAEKAFISTVNSDLYCELSIDDIFCLVFQH